MTAIALPQFRPPQADADVLDLDEVREVLRIRRPELVAEVAASIRSAFAEEQARLVRIDTKATSLLTAAGLAVPILSTLLPHAPAGWQTWVVLAAAAVGVVAGLLATAALRVLTTGRVPDRAILNAEQVREADEAATPEAARAEYTRYLIASTWEVYTILRHVNDQRAKLVKRGQHALALALMLALVGGACIALGPHP